MNLPACCRGSPALVIVGGAVLDVQAHPSKSHDVRRGGSVPGQVRQVPGGVGRNIAEAASYLLAADGPGGSSCCPGGACCSKDGGCGSGCCSKDGNCGANGSGCCSKDGSCCCFKDGSCCSGGASSGASTSSSGSSSSGSLVAHAGSTRSSGSSATTTGSSSGSSSNLMLITVLGCDPAGDTLAAHCQSLGLPPSGLLRVPGAATPCVSIVFDRSGEVAASVADVAGLEAHLDAAAISSFRSEIAAARLLVIDGNLSVGAGLAAAEIAKGAGVPVLFEPISVPKAARAVPLLPHLTYITPNAEELLAIAAALKSSQPSGGRTAAAATAAAAGGGGGRGGGGGAAARRLADLAPAAAAVLAAGVKCILLTMGEHGAALLRLEGGASGGACCGGVCCGGACCGGAGGCGCGSCGAAPCTTTTSSTTTSSSNAASRRPAVVAHHLPSPPARVVSVSGAGDCLAAAFAAALARGGAPCATPEQGLREGLLAARAAVESEGNVPSRARLVGAVRGGGGGGPAGEMAVLTFPVASML